MLESFLQILNGEKPNRTVWTADVWYYLTGLKCAGQDVSHQFTEIGYLEYCQSLNTMPYYWYGASAACKGVCDDTVQSQITERNGHAETKWVTPVGELAKHSEFMTESCSSGITKHPVETLDDLKTLAYIVEHSHLEPHNIDTYRQRLELWKKYDGLPILGMLRSPLSSLICEWAGPINTVYLLADHPELVKEILVKMEAQEAPVIEALCELAPPVVHFCDNMTSETMTSLYDEHMADRHRRRLKPLHEAGVKCVVHLDGVIAGLLPKLIDVGIDGLEALTPKPVGDLTVDQIRDIADNSTTILWGAVPGAMFSNPFTWPDMKKHIEHVLDAWKNTPFVLGVADQIPPDGDITFCKKIADML